MEAWNLGTAWESIGDALDDRTAIVHGDVRRTWREFDERSARLAAGLRAAGLGRDSKVASYLYNGSEYLENLFAAFKLRATPVNVNYRYLADELVYLLDNSDAEVLFFHGGIAERVAEVRPRAPKVRLWVQVDDGSAHLDGALAYEDLVGSHEPMERIDRSGDDWYFLYTGGTTGIPKGVMWRHEDLCGAIGEPAYQILGASMPERPEDAGAVARQVVDGGRNTVHLPASPLMHGTGAFSTFQALLVGGTIVLLEGRHFDPDELWRAVEREHVSQTAIVGDAFAKPMLAALERARDESRPYDLSSLVMMVSSGVIWSAEVKQGLLEHGSFVCIDALGSSEGVGFGGSISAPGAAQPTAKFTIGAHAKVFTEDGREVAPGSGDIGLLALGGPIPSGYYKDDEKTAATFRTFAGRRWSVPGDWAQVEADGSIVLLGRGSVCINSGGEKIFPEEVEEAVKRHPAVADCLVVGVPDDRFGEAVSAVVSLRDGATATSGDLSASLDGLARYKHPRHWVFVDEVVRGPNGKADYRWARDAAAAAR